jgi:hypothetical protein
LAKDIGASKVDRDDVGPSKRKVNEEDGSREKKRPSRHMQTPIKIGIIAN